MSFVEGPTANSFDAPSRELTIEDAKRQRLLQLAMASCSFGVLFLFFVSLQIADAIQPTWAPLAHRLSNPLLLVVLALLGFTLLWAGLNEADRALRGKWSPPADTHENRESSEVDKHGLA